MALKNFKRNNKKLLQVFEHDQPTPLNLNRLSKVSFSGSSLFTSLSTLGFLRAAEDYNFSVTDYKYNPSAWKYSQPEEVIIPPEVATVNPPPAIPGDITPFIGSSFITITPGEPDLTPAFPIVPPDIPVTPVDPVDPETPETDVSGVDAVFYPSIGDEDTAIKINIQLTELDPNSEATEIRIFNVPDGAVLSAGTLVTSLAEGDYWLVQPDDIDNLTITPPADSSDNIRLDIVITTVEQAGGATSEVEGSVTIVVRPIADDPIVDVTPTASGDEDSEIQIFINEVLVSDTDGSETIEVRLLDVPEGSSVNGATKSGDYYVIEDMSNLYITPPENSSDEFTLRVQFVVTDRGNDDIIPDINDRIIKEVQVNVNAVADTPNLVVQDSSGDEDTAIALSINSTLNDTDGSETLSILISAVPTGASLSAGIDNGDGTWTLTPDQLAGLTITPPLNSDEDFSLTITATATESENGDTADITDTINVAVNAVADTPNLTVEDSSGDEDTAIALSINSTLNDTDGSETLSILISGVPNGASLSSGVDNGDGTWSLTPDQLAGLTITPPLNSDEDFGLTITATATEDENGDTADITDTINITVNAIADDPNLTVQDATGDEDTAIALTINSTLYDTDGSETLSILISGVPTGANLSSGIDNGDGTWTLSPAQLDGLSITPPLNSDEDFSLTVTATSTEGENGDTADVTETINVTVNAVADTPNLSVQDATGDEDTAIPLTIDSTLNDTDGSETLSILISGIPTGASLSSGVNNGDGTWSLTPEQLDGLTITPPLNSDADFSLTITATATESENGDTADITEVINITVNAVADTPSLTTQDATGDEDTAIALTINSTLNDTDGSEELSVEISGVPNGATLSAGTDNGDGSWTLTESQLTGLTITPPLNSDEDFILNVTATATEGENGDTAQISSSINVTVNAVADEPNLSVQDATGEEDSIIPLSISSSLNDLDGSEELSILVSGVPTGATLSAGVDNSSGNWTLTPDQLAGLTLTPPLNSDDDFILTVTAISTEGENGDTAQVTDTINVNITAEADTPNLVVNPTTIGDEDTAIPLTIDASLNDNDDSETLSITISEVPAGSTLSAGVNNGDGTWTLTQAQLSGLTITPTPNLGDDFELTITATATEANDNSSTSISDTITVEVNPIADTPNVNLPDTFTGDEDTWIPIDITGITLNDLDGSEQLTILLEGVPSDVQVQGATISQDNGDTITYQVSDPSNLQLLPPRNSGDDFDIDITYIVDDYDTPSGTIQDSISETQTVTIDVVPVADQIDFTMDNLSVDEDGSVALSVASVDPSTADEDGSETVEVFVSNVPIGVTITNATDLGGGRWQLLGPIPDSSVVPIADSDEDFNLTVEIVTTETENGSTATGRSEFTVSVTAVADKPDLEVISPVTTDEDTKVKLDITTSPTDIDGSESIADVYIDVQDLDVRFVNSADEEVGVIENGVYKFTYDESQDLFIIPPPNSDESFEISVISLAKETNDNSEEFSDIKTIKINVNAVADETNLTANDIIVDEDSSGVLDIFGNLIDDDGSETAELFITGVPDGVTISNATDLGGGRWEFNYEDRNNLVITPIADSDIDLDLTLEVVTTETSNGDSITTTDDFIVNINAISDPPILTVNDATTDEDTAVAISISTAVTDIDGSESIDRIVISGVLTGSTFNQGTDNRDGSWTFTEAQLSGLEFTPPPNSDIDQNWTVTSYSKEAKTTDDQSDNESSTSETMTITVKAITDDINFSSSPLTVNEDEQGVLDIQASLIDDDGSETLVTILSGIPAGSSIEGASDNGDGTWTVDGYSALKIIPPLNSDDDFTISIEHTVTETATGISKVFNDSLDVTVTAVADTPNLTTQDVTTDEDTAVPLNIISSLNDLDGSETLTLTIANIPTGASLSAGVDNGDGTWTITAAQIAGLAITPPLNFSGTFDLDITAIATEARDGSVANITQTITVTVDAVADEIIITANDVITDEDTIVDLDISLQLSDDDGSESITEVLITGVPDTATLNNGTIVSSSGGFDSYLVSIAELEDLKYLPTLNSDEDITLTVSAESTDENGSTLITTQDFTIQVNAVADPITVNGIDTVTDEDTPVPIQAGFTQVDQDGSELVTIQVEVPDGAVINVPDDQIVINDPKTYEITRAQLLALEFTPPPNFSGDTQLTVITTTTEQENGDFQSASKVINVKVNAVADEPVLINNGAEGDEDSTFFLNLEAVTVDQDGSETLTVIVSDVPTGVVLGGGVLKPDGTYIFTQDEFNNATITPAQNSDEDFDLTIQIVAQDENGSQTSKTFTETIIVDPVNDGVRVTGSATGDEDTFIDLNINSSLIDNDGSESVTQISLTIPAGYELASDEQTYPISGTDQVVTIDAQYIPSLRIKPPEDSNEDFTLNFEVITEEANGGTLTQTINYDVDVVGVVDEPVFSVADVSILEDSGDGDSANLIELTIDPNSLDSDGSETYEYIISNLPENVSFSNGAAAGLNRWVLTEADLENLYIIPANDDDQDYNLTFNIRVTENDGDQQTYSTDFNVEVEAVADTPSLTVADGWGEEKVPIKLNIKGSLNDLDGSETLSYILEADQMGQFVDSSGKKVGTPVNPGDEVIFTPEEIDDLFFKTNQDGIVNITVTARSTEAANLDTADNTKIITLEVFETGGGGGDTGLIDIIVPDIEVCEDDNAKLDIDLIEEQNEPGDINTVTISNLPPGTTLVDSGGNEIGTDNGGGSWTLDESEINDAYLDFPDDFSGEVDLSVTYEKIDGSSGITQTTSDTFHVTVNQVDDFPPIEDKTVSINEDEWTDINLDIGSFGPEENSVVLIENVPDGVEFSAGNKNPDGTWSIQAQDLADLQIRGPENSADNFTLHFEWVPASSSGCEPDIEDIDADITIEIDEVADRVDLNTVAGSGDEDTVIPITIDPQLTDTDGSESITSIRIIGLPTHGTLTGVNPDGTIDDLGAVTYTPDLNYSGQDSITVEVITVDTDSDSPNDPNDTFTTTQDLEINIAPITDPPGITIDDVAILEDGQAALTYTIDPNADLDQDYTVIISGVPDGAKFNQGYNQGDGSWLVVGQQRDGLLFTPPPNYSGDIVLTADITTEDSGNGDVLSSQSTFTVSVEAVADAPYGAGLDATLNEGEDVQIFISGELIDRDGSETLSFEIDPLPNGAQLSNGTFDSDRNVWILTQEDTQNLYITNTDNINGDFTLTARAIATEVLDGNPNDADDIATTDFELQVIYNPVADIPNLSLPTEVTGDEDTDIPLDITASLNDTDGSEVLDVIIQGVPSDAMLNSGSKQTDGSWVVKEADLSTLTIRFAEDLSGVFELSVTARARETSNGDTAVSETLTYNVNVAPVADELNLDATSETKDEGEEIPLNIVVSLNDLDGSEVIQDIVTIEGLPAGFSLNKGSLNSTTNKWEVNKSDLTGLLIIPASGSGEDFTLTIGATTVDTDTTGTDTLETTTTVDIVINDIADTPTLTTTDTTGSEDTAIPISIDSQLVDTDGSEVLSIVITDEGGSFNQGTNNGDGTWSFTPGQLTGLEYTPESNLSGQVTLNITATATEQDGGDTASISDTLTIDVTPVADTPTLSTTNATGDEDTAIDINISASLVDPSETLTIEITDPQGGTFSAGVNNAGVWTLTAQELSGLTYTPPTDFNGDITLDVKAISTESDNTTAETTDTLTISVTPKIDPPIISANDVVVDEDGTVSLDITASIDDPQGGEVLTVTISDSNGGLLSDGVNSGSSITVDASELGNVTYTPLPDLSGNITLDISASVTDGVDTEVSNSTTTVTVTPIADIPELTLTTTKTTDEDTAVDLDISGTLTDTDGSETLSFEIIDDSGGALSAGTQNGNTWTLTEAQLTGLTYTPASNFSGEANLSVTAISTETSNDDSASSSPQDITITINPVADAPNLAVDDITATDGDLSASIDITSSLVDPDEVLSFEITNLPSGVTLNSGSFDGLDTWTLDPSEITGLELNFGGFNSNFTFDITAISTETANGDFATTVDNVDVNFNPVLMSSTQALLSVQSEDDPNLSNLQDLNYDEVDNMDDIFESQESEVNENEEDLTDNLDDITTDDLIIEEHKPIVI